ncbi:MAG: histidinol-phosphate transaminase [Anaerolineae bacterium]|nr:histidinol-phosphate transaminase [Anaerolineae bacterium]
MRPVTINPETLLAPHLRALQGYTPIVPPSVLAQRLGHPQEQIIKLDANENLYGPPPAVRQALADALPVNIYPDPDQTAFRAAVGRYLGMAASHIIGGAGADEVIDLVVRAFVALGDAVIDLPPTFGMYRWQADVAGARYVPVPRRADFSVDVAAVERAVRSTPNAKLLFIANPNNPDGSLLADEDLKRLLALPIMVVLDEAYIDFSAHPGHARWVLEHENLIVLRTFSKLAGLAGLRVGYGVFPEKLVPHLWKIKQPYTPNVAGEAAAIAALSDPAYLRDVVARIVAERERMRQLLMQIPGFYVFPSQANFVLCRVADSVRVNGGDPSWHPARRIKAALEQHGVLVRYFDKEGLRDCIRVSVGLPEHTDALMRALEVILR